MMYLSEIYLSVFMSVSVSGFALSRSGCLGSTAEEVPWNGTTREFKGSKQCEAADVRMV